MSWEHKSGEGWVVFMWDQKMLRYQYINHIFKDEVAEWLKQKKVSLSDINEEPYPPEFAGPDYQAAFGESLHAHLRIVKNS